MQIDLKSARIRAGISTRDMAKEIGKTLPTLYAYEQGKRDPPNSVMETYSSLTGIPRDELTCLFSTTREDMVMCL